MADEAQLLTVNAAGTSWVDVTPGAVSTGYQAQNTNIEAGRVGMDATHVIASGGGAILQQSGPVDVSGVAYKITSAVTLTPVSDGTYYIKLVAGTGSSLTPTLSSSKGVWDAAKNALYDAGERVLNWQVVRSDGVVSVAKVYDQGVSTVKVVSSTSTTGTGEAILSWSASGLTNATAGPSVKIQRPCLVYVNGTLSTVNDLPPTRILLQANVAGSWVAFGDFGSYSGGVSNDALALTPGTYRLFLSRNSGPNETTLNISMYVAGIWGSTDLSDAV